MSPAHEGLPAIGEQVQKRYRLDAVLAHGGMGVVYRAHDLMLDRPVAVKVLPRSLDEGVVRQRFLREARLAASVHDRHVVDIFDAGFLAEDQPFLVMELLHGEPLHEQLRRKGAMKAYRAGVMCTQLLHGVGAVHAAGIIHRDLKPSNVFLVWGPELFVKLIDFGVSKSLDDDLTQITEPGLAVGTPSYMAPEQVLGKGADERTDVYAVGATLFEALTGKPLVKPDKHVHRVFDAILKLTPPTPSSLREDHLNILDDITLKALARDPKERYGSCSEMEKAVESRLESLIPRGRA
ncbi:MAG: serine/threonine protein kinase [Deltaproteobacteria bacterium]|nr:serine/threonine protein kinase [Deltaproteobacteria bacterium]